MPFLTEARSLVLAKMVGISTVISPGYINTKPSSIILHATARIHTRPDETVPFCSINNSTAPCELSAIRFKAHSYQEESLVKVMEHAGHTAFE